MTPRPTVENRSVLVVGESLIDVVRDASGNELEIVGGSPANVAQGVARLGNPVRLATAIGRDDRGQRIASELEYSKVQLDPGSWRLATTSSATAVLEADGSAHYTFDIEWPPIPVPTVRAERLLHIGSFGTYLHPGAESVIQAVERMSDHMLISFDPNIRPALMGTHAVGVSTTERLIGKADVVKLSDEDASWLYPALSIDEVLNHLLELGVTIAAVTRGASGSVLASRIARAEIAAPAVRVRDTVGAGDSYTAALIDAILRDPTILSNPDEGALRSGGTHAATAAALTVQRNGAQLPTRSELQRAIAAHAQ